MTGKQMRQTLNQVNLSPNVTIGGSYNTNSYGNLNTISINSLNGFNSNELFNHNMHPGVKKYEIYESPEDILVLSVAWKRLRDAGVHGTVSKLLDRTLFSLVIPEDRTVANEIRDYYSKKIMMLKLKGIDLTPYRTDLNTFIHSDGMKFREDVFGMVYYLPQFYTYDNELDEVREKVKTTDLISNVIKMPGKGIPQDKSLEPIAKIKFVNKRLKQKQYWFKDVHTDGGVVLSFDNKNPLEHIWDHMFETKELLSIRGHYFLKERDNFEYFSVSDWNLLNI